MWSLHLYSRFYFEVGEAWPFPLLMPAFFPPNKQQQNKTWTEEDMNLNTIFKSIMEHIK